MEYKADITQSRNAIKTLIEQLASVNKAYLDQQNQERNVLLDNDETPNDGDVALAKVNHSLVVSAIN